MYKITVKQGTEHKNKAGETWTHDEVIEGTATNFETVTALMGIITEVFPNTSVIISTSNTIETEED